jgi:predicted RNA binding protein YcfA (HicA-like mRNA interferase family)
MDGYTKFVYPFAIWRRCGMGQVFSSRERIALIEADGWYLAKVTGDHHHFKHPSKPGKETVPHLMRDVAKGTANSILKQAGLK